MEKTPDLSHLKNFTFHAKVRQAVAEHEHDSEHLHKVLETLMGEELIAYGQDEAIALIRKQTRWYA